MACLDESLFATRVRWPGFAIAIAIATAMAAGACASPPPTGRQAGAPTGTPSMYAGWYMEHAGSASLQPCGTAAPLRVPKSSALSARARAFDLGEDMPIYVRVVGVAHEGTLAIVRVEQFGSPVPVRDCALDGVVIPAPEPRPTD